MLLSLPGSAAGYQATAVFVYPRKCDRRARQMDRWMENWGVPRGFEPPKEGPSGKLAEPSFCSPALPARQGWTGAFSVQQGLR